MRLNVNWLPRFIRQRILDYALRRNTKQVNDLAPNIRNNKHLRQIVQAAKPEFRRAVYDQLKPHLKFRPKPFFLLNK